MSSISQATTLFAITLVLLRSRMKTYLWVQRRSEDPRSIFNMPFCDSHQSSAQKYNPVYQNTFCFLTSIIIKSALQIYDFRDLL